MTDSSWQLLAAPGRRRKAVRLGNRLKRKLNPPCRLHNVKREERFRGEESRNGDQQRP